MAGPSCDGDAMYIPYTSKMWFRSDNCPSTAIGPNFTWHMLIANIYFQ